MRHPLSPLKKSDAGQSDSDAERARIWAGHQLHFDELTAKAIAAKEARTAASSAAASKENAERERDRAFRVKAEAEEARLARLDDWDKACERAQELIKALKLLDEYQIESILDWVVYPYKKSDLEEPLFLLGAVGYQVPAA